MGIMAGGWVQGWMLWRRWVDVNEDEEGQARSGLIRRWVNVNEDEEGEARLGLWRRWVNANEDEACGGGQHVVMDGEEGELRQAR